MKLTSRHILITFFVSVVITLYLKLSGLLREFNNDVARMLTKIAKHPAAWIDWGWLTGTSLALFIIWLKNKDKESAPTNAQWWMIFIVAIGIGIPSALLLFTYLRQRSSERRPFQIEHF